MQNFVRRRWPWLVAGGGLGLILVLVLVLGGFGGRPTGANIQASPTNSGDVYLALGDSVAYGVGASPPEELGYAGVFYNEYLKKAQPEGWVFKNLAIPGETTDSFLSRPKGRSQLQKVQDEIEAARQSGHKVKLITLTIGGNDVLGARGSNEAGKLATLQHFDQNFQQILKELVARTAGQAEIIVTTYYNPFAFDNASSSNEAEWVQRFNRLIQQRAEEYKAQIADFYQPVLGHEADYTWVAQGDIHPTTAGHAVLAAQVWQATGYKLPTLAR